MIPAPKLPLDVAQVLKKLRDLDANHKCLRTLKWLDELCSEDMPNRACMEEAGVAEAMVTLIVKLARDKRTDCIEESVRILNRTWTTSRAQLTLLVEENYDFVDALSWILRLDIERHNNVPIKTNVAMILKRVMEAARVTLLDRLKLETIKTIVNTLREIRTSQPGIKSILKALIEACPWSRNRSNIIQAGAVFELIELELDKPKKGVSELIFELLAQLCSCPDGMEEILKHAGAIAMLAKRTLRVSPAVDNWTVHILWLISHDSATDEVILEMLQVGAVSKLCMVLQADCTNPVKGKARSILRTHSNVWNNSPCMAVYLSTRQLGR